MSLPSPSASSRDALCDIPFRPDRCPSPPALAASSHERRLRGRGRTSMQVGKEEGVPGSGSVFALHDRWLL